MSYRDKQQELIGLLEDIHTKTGIPTVLQDVPRNRDNIEMIDPFTFLMNFNRAGIKDDKRRDVIAIIQEFFHLSVQLPADFDGTFSSSTASKWTQFFRDSNHLRYKTSTMNLWELASRAWRGMDSPALFAYCLEFPSVGVGSLTQGLYWCNPASFIPLDSKCSEFLASILGSHAIPELKTGHEIEFVQAYDKMMTELRLQYPGYSRTDLFYRSRLKT